MSKKVLGFPTKQKFEAWWNAFALCLACGHKWLALVEVRTSLFKLECPECKKQNSFASLVPPEYSSDMAQAYPEEVDNEPT